MGISEIFQEPFKERLIKKGKKELLEELVNNGFPISDFEKYSTSGSEQLAKLIVDLKSRQKRDT